MTHPAVTPRAAGTSARRWLFLATSESALSTRRGRLTRMVERGDDVTLVHRGRLRLGELDPGVVVHDDTQAPRRRGVEVRRVSGRLPSWAAGGLDRVDPVMRDVRRAEVVVLLDDGAGELREDLFAIPRDAVVWSADEADEGMRQDHHWTVLEDRLDQIADLPAELPRKTHRVTVSIEALLGRAALAQPRADHRAVLVDLARRAYNRADLGGGDAIASGVALFEPRFGADRRGDLLLRASRVRAQLLVEPVSPDVQPVVQELLEAADVTLADGDLEACAVLTTEALNLLFHRVIHTTAEQTPLVEDPQGYLAHWRESAVARLLAGPGSGSTSDRAPAPASSARCVVLLPGSYAHHAGPLVEAIGTTDAELTVLDVRAGSLTGMMLQEDLVLLRLRQALGQVGAAEVRRHPGVSRSEPDVGALLAGADVVVADWVDKGAVWASLAAPPDARVVVRVHSADALSGPLHLVDWSRVDDLVFVSEHIGEVFEAVAPPGVRARRHVVLNPVDPARFASAPDARADRTLGMVAWGRRVKDPLMALDVLALLARRDPTWRLRLVGEDFPDELSAESLQYQRDFRRRALELDVVDRIDYVGQTARLPDHLPQMGFVLSTSVRESCPIGVLEAMAAGAVPVVREWPTFARFRGAARLLPERFVVDSAQEAADLIWSLRRPEDRAAAAQQARASLHEAVFDHKGAMRRLGQVVVG